MLELKEIEGEDYGRDLVEVIRCRNCKYGVDFRSELFLRCELRCEMVGRDDFCSRARMRFEQVAVGDENRAD